MAAKPPTHSKAKPAVATKMLDRMSHFMGAAQEQADSRFSQALAVVAKTPTGTAPVGSATATPTPMVGRGEDYPVYEPGVEAVIGQIYRVRLGLIDPNEVGVRQWYTVEAIDMIARTLPQGQEDAGHGFVKPSGRIELTDGGTRLRSAKASGLEWLLVKIEAPLERKAQFFRSISLNDQRTAHTALDLAVSFAKRLDDGTVASQSEIVSALVESNSKPMSLQEVGMHVRVGRMPARVLDKMSKHECTMGIGIAYAISDIFAAKLPEDEAEQIALAVVEQIQIQGLSVSKSKELIRTKLEGKRRRAQPETTPVRYGSASGAIKTFPDGRFEFAIKGLSNEQVAELRSAVSKLCEPLR